MDQARAMGDLGLALLSLGEVNAAERALHHVVRVAGSGELAANAMIELMHSASFRRDRVSFERWRERAMRDGDMLMPNVRADYHLKAGIGFARFGSCRRAEGELRHAHEIAASHELHELVFHIERILGGVNECGAPDEAESAALEPTKQTESLRDLSASLATLDA